MLSNPACWSKIKQRKVEISLVKDNGFWDSFSEEFRWTLVDRVFVGIHGKNGRC